MSKELKASSYSGLHQTNFDPNNPLKFNLLNETSEVDKTVASVFQSFKYKCISTWKDLTYSQDQDAHIPTIVLDERKQEEALCNLPFYCKIIILSKLETIDICKLSTTSKYWNDICSDKFLWRELLFRDSIIWKSICSKSYPLMSDKEILKLLKCATNDQASICLMSYYDRICTRGAIDYKSVYMKSACQRFANRKFIGIRKLDVDCDEELQFHSKHAFPRFIRNILISIRSENTQVVMLGPGMESNNTSKIFKCLMWARPDLFEIKRLLPGGHDGVGSGVELEFKGATRFNLVALYSNNRRERGDVTGLQRLLNSRMLDVSHKDICESKSDKFANIQHQFTLSASVLNFLKLNHNNRQLIYVVDATKGQSIIDISYNRLELQTLLDGIRQCESESRTSSKKSVKSSLLVICCCATMFDERFSCVEIAAYLDLASITDRHWFVQQVNVLDLDGLEDGLTWLFKQS